MSNTDTKIKIEDKILELIESSNVIFWRMPWLYGDTDIAFQGSAYTGINKIVTAFARAVFGYKSRVWLTRTKINALNGKVYDPKKKRYCKVNKNNDKKSTFIHIKKGAKGVPIIWWDWVPKHDANGNDMYDDNGNKIMFPLLKTYTVFNADEIEGFDPTPFEPTPAETGIDIKSCEELEKRMIALYKDHPEIIHGGDKACYYPSIDRILIPNPAQFISLPEYGAALAHELGHSTGAEFRLNRNLKGYKGGAEYGYEELVAEFTAPMVLEKLGIHDMPQITNSAAYIKSWATSIRSNPGMLFDAINAAYKATDWIFGIKPEDKYSDKSNKTTA